MTRRQLENKGWRLYSGSGDNQTYTIGDPISSHCMWLVRYSRSPKIEVYYGSILLLEGWLGHCSAEDLHGLLKWVIGKK